MQTYQLSITVDGHYDQGHWVRRDVAEVLRRLGELHPQWHITASLDRKVVFEHRPRVRTLSDIEFDRGFNDG